MNNKITLEPEQYYHIYNHAVGFDNFFIEKPDYNNFLDKYIKYIVPISNTFAYCLMPNHFHFFVQIKPDLELHKMLKFDNNDKTVLDKSINYRFSHFFNSYAQYFNKKYSRKGGLFKNSFQRKFVKTEKYFVKLVHYIHSNPVEDEFVESIDQWEYSSYNSIANNRKTFLEKDTVISYFEDIDNFKFVHKNALI
jgi:REP element-mobilizing transposase RayT